MDHLSALFLAAAIPSAILVGLSKGGLPVVGMLGVPLLTLLISPVEAAALLLPIYVVSDMFGLYVYRRDYDLRNLKLLIPSGMFGVLVGYMTSSLIPEAAVTLLIGMIGTVFCINNFVRRNHDVVAKPANAVAGTFWGTVAGFTSFVSHSGAPPFQVYVLPQKLEKMVYAGTSTILFAVINATKLPAYYALGTLTLSNVEIAAMLAIPASLATILGAKMVRIIPERPFFIAIQITLFVVSIKLVFDGLQGMKLFG